MISKIQEKAEHIARIVRRDGFYQGPRDEQQTTLARYLYQLDKFTIKNDKDGSFKVFPRNDSVEFAKTIFTKPSGSYHLPEDIDVIVVLAYIRRTFKGSTFEFDAAERKVTFIDRDGVIKKRIDKIDSVARLKELMRYIEQRINNIL